mmetsp:Transcript_26001/g.50979  ORF Transcript_26001/g.50979 Transcript_26001/m.50979 type:complete len:217 (-) Transcript_26001:98-748(-)
MFEAKTICLNGSIEIVFSFRKGAEANTPYERREERSLEATHRAFTNLYRKACATCQWDQTEFGQPRKEARRWERKEGRKEARWMDDGWTHRGTRTPSWAGKRERFFPALFDVSLCPASVVCATNISVCLRVCVSVCLVSVFPPTVLCLFVCLLVHEGSRRKAGPTNKIQFFEREGNSIFSQLADRSDGWKERKRNDREEWPCMQRATSTNGNRVYD